MKPDEKQTAPERIYILPDLHKENEGKFYREWITENTPRRQGIEYVRTDLARDVEVDVRVNEVARRCAYAASNYFDELYLASNKERAGGFTSANVQIAALVEKFLPLIGSAEKPAWQPIETAPKDGTRILLWIVHRNAQYSKHPINEGWVGIAIGSWTTFNEGGWTWNGLAGEPSYWTSLPEPPSTTALELLKGKQK